jgi:acetyl esterase
MAIFHRFMQFSGIEKMMLRGDLPRLRRLSDKFIKPRLPIGTVEDRLIDGPGGPIPIRIYRPVGQAPFPIVIFFHGGGFVFGSIATHENVTRSMANEGPAVVISVDYRLAPEHPFPAALEDAYAAVQWAAENASAFDGDPARLAVAGDSAGGNLAAGVSLKARDEQGPPISQQILLYPVLILDEFELASRRDFEGYILSEEMAWWMRDGYLPDPGTRRNPYASPLLAGDHGNLPPAYIMTAEFDPLRDEARLYAEYLRQAGVSVVYREYKGMLHGFLSMADVLPWSEHLLKAPSAVYADMSSMLAGGIMETGNGNRLERISA